MENLYNFGLLFFNIKLEKAVRGAEQIAFSRQLGKNSSQVIRSSRKMHVTCGPLKFTKRITKKKKLFFFNSYKNVKRTPDNIQK